MNSSPDALWMERLRVLRELYALGLQVLAEPMNASDPRIAPQWSMIDRHWDVLQTQEIALHDAPPPSSLDLRRALLEQAQSNAALYRSLEMHCRETQAEISTLLARLDVHQQLQSFEAVSALIHHKA